MHILAIFLLCCWISFYYYALEKKFDIKYINKSV